MAHFTAVVHIYTYTLMFFVVEFFLKIPVMALRMIQLEEERERMKTIGRHVLIKGEE